MASIPPVSVTCPACQEVIVLPVTTKRTSEQAPAAAVVFIEVDREPLTRHLATHEADEQEAA